MERIWKQTNGDPDDILCVIGDYMLRVEWMDKRQWWYNVYYKDDELLHDYMTVKTKEEAKWMAETFYFVHKSAIDSTKEKQKA